MMLVLPVSRGYGSLESAVSCLCRVYEEYPVEEVLVLDPGVGGGVVEAVERAARSLGLGFDTHRVPGGGGTVWEGSAEDRLARSVRKEVVERLCREGRSLVSVVSPGSRRLASALALACAGSCSDVVHVHFYWGEWSGLPYPYTPRRLEPLVPIMSVRGGLEKGRTRSAAPRMPGVEEGGAPWGVQLPPLRACVAELARRLNETSRAACRTVDEGRECGSLLVEVEVGGLGRSWTADPCREEEVAGLVSGVSKLLLGGSGGREWREVLAWCGLCELRAIGPQPATVRPLEDLRGRLVADTTCLYHGVHNLAYLGAGLALPECVSEEVRARLAESVKRGRLDRLKDLTVLLAYLALEEVLWAGASVYPSPAPPCDTAMPRMYPVLLDGRVLATGDDGAYRRWSRSPVSKLSEVVKTSWDPAEATMWGRAGLSPRGLPRLYHGLHQLLIALELAAQNGLVDKLVVEVDRRRVRPPVKPILEKAGLR